MGASTTEQTKSKLDVFMLQLATKYSLSRTYTPGETIFAEGDLGSTMILILSGSVKITKLSLEDNRQMTIATRGAGEFFGEMALVEHSPRFATVIAETDCQVLEFSQENFKKVISEQPILAIRVLRSLSSKLRESDSIRITELEENNRLLNASNRELTKLNVFLDCVIDQSPTAIFLTTVDGIVTRMNMAAREMFERDCGNNTVHIDKYFKGLRFSELRQGSAGTWQGQVSGLRGSEEFQAYLSVTSLSAQDDSIVHLIVCQDISELHAFNDTIRELEKYSSAQRSAAECVYDLNNFFSIVVCGVDFLLGSLTPSQEKTLKATIDAIQKATDDVLNYVENTMVYGEDLCEIEPVDTESVVKAVIRFCKSQLRFRDINVELKTDRSMPEKIPVKRVQIQSVLMNLLSNAAEALTESPPKGGKTILIELAGFGDPKRVIIRVSDNGPGVAPELIPKLFKKRQTTKSDGKGIGLISVNRIIQSHNGSITVNSDPGAGASFEISLPLTQGKWNA